MNDIPSNQESEKETRVTDNYGIPMFKVPFEIASIEPLTYEKILFSLDAPDNCDHITYELPFRIKNTEEASRRGDCKAPLEIDFCDE